jgi:hypothetical protein
MTVKTKYGNGTLLGIDIDNGTLTYKVLVENKFQSDLSKEECQDNKILPVEERIYNCLSVTIIADSGQEVVFNRTINIK